MLILVGLGNPGAKHAGQRHNIGFMAIEALARRWAFGPERSRFHALATEGTIASAAGSVRCLLLKPQTFMNESGRAVGDALAFYKLTPADLIVFHDEIDMADGRFRMKTGGGAAGHNGLRSITARIGPDYRRARMGVGHPGHKDLVLGHVLADFHKAEQPWVEGLCRACADAAPLLVEGLDDRYQTEVARLAPAQKLDPKTVAKSLI